MSPYLISFISCLAFLCMLYFKHHTNCESYLLKIEYFEGSYLILNTEMGFIIEHLSVLTKDAVDSYGRVVLWDYYY